MPSRSVRPTWRGSHIINSRRPGDGQDPRIDLVAANLRGLPPVTIISAQIDPLLSDGLNLTKALRRAGVTVMQRTYPGVTQEFFGMGSVVRGAAKANAWAVQRLRPALSTYRW
jgi:acetyl esterase/lipase